MRGGGGAAYGALFVDQKAVERIATGPTELSSGDDCAHLSPYIRLIIAVSKLEKVSPENQPKKETIEDAVRQFAPKYLGDEVLGVTFLGYLATAIREPSSQEGRARKGPTQKG